MSSGVASSAAAGAETTQTPTAYTGYSAAIIDNCGQDIAAAEKTFSIFADYDSGVQNQSLTSLMFSGWNHSNNENKTRAEWASLSVSNRATYDFVTNAAVNDSCNNVDTLNMVLVKKINNWDFQHSNGFERNILAFGYKFADIESLVVDVKIDTTKTSIPSVASLKTTYANYVDATTVDTLEDGKVNIGIVIYDGKTASTWMAKKIIQLDQTALGDKWVRVTIPMSGMKHCLEANFNCADRPFSELGNKTIAGIQFVGETKSGGVLRGAITSWNTNIPETFKEAGLSFKKIEFKLK